MKQAKAITLTASEWRVLRLKAFGLTTREVAHHLGRSEQTIKNQLISIYDKLEARSLTEAVTRVGWLTVPDDV